MREKWNWILGFEGRYKISNTGEVVSYLESGSHKEMNEPQRIMMGSYDKDGYRVVMLRGNGKIKCAKIHRLVLESFRGPCPHGCVTRHLDGDKANNQVDNLVWGTHKENFSDHHGHPSIGVSGEDNYNSKLTEKDVENIRLRGKSGELHREIAKDYPVKGDKYLA